VAFGQSETYGCYTVRDNSNPHWLEFTVLKIKPMKIIKK